MTVSAVPPRSDISNPTKRVAAAALLVLLRLYEQLKSRLLVDVPHAAMDAFYEDSWPVAGCDVGDVVASRAIEVRLFRRVLPIDAWHVKFRTTLPDGEPALGVATVMRSRRRRSNGKLLSYQPAIDSLGPTGDPSYALRRGDHLELPIMLLALRRGWVVVATDWTGPQHSFVDLPLAARFVLDGIRAALQFEPTGLGSTASVSLWGYSGGALATLFAAEQHPRHAPELNITAVAAGGAGVDITSSPKMFEAGNLLSGIPFGACVAASRSFPDFDLAGHLTPLGQEMVAAAEEMTMEQLAMGFPFLRLSSILTVPTLSDVPGALAGFEATRCGQSTPTAPLFLYHAIHDQAPDIADVDKLVRTYRQNGADVTYRRYRFGEHMIVMFRAVPAALRFLATAAPDRRSLISASAPRSRERCGQPR